MCKHYKPFLIKEERKRKRLIKEDFFFFLFFFPKNDAWVTWRSCDCFLRGWSLLVLKIHGVYFFEGNFAMDIGIILFLGPKEKEFFFFVLFPCSEKEFYIRIFESFYSHRDLYDHEILVNSWEFCLAIDNIFIFIKTQL